MGFERVFVFVLSVWARVDLRLLAVSFTECCRYGATFSFTLLLLLLLLLPPCTKRSKGNSAPCELVSRGIPAEKPSHGRKDPMVRSHHTAYAHSWKSETTEHTFSLFTLGFRTRPFRPQVFRILELRECSITLSWLGMGVLRRTREQEWRGRR